MSLIIMAFPFSKFLLQLRISKTSVASVPNDPFKTPTSDFSKSLVTGHSLPRNRFASFKQEFWSTLLSVW